MEAKKYWFTDMVEELTNGKDDRKDRKAFHTALDKTISTMQGDKKFVTSIQELDDETIQKEYTKAAFDEVDRTVSLINSLLNDMSPAAKKLYTDSNIQEEGSVMDLYFDGVNSTDGEDNPSEMETAIYLILWERLEVKRYLI